VKFLSVKNEGCAEEKTGEQQQHDDDDPPTMIQYIIHSRDHSDPNANEVPLRHKKKHAKADSVDHFLTLRNS
jgi:hypothetical protein